MSNQPIIITDLTGDGALKSFLEAQLCLSPDTTFDDSPEEILRQSPILGPYLLQRQNVLAPKTDAIWVHIPSPRTESTLSFRSWDIALQTVSVAIATICSAGASKVLLDLLKTWVEARNGREIHFKKGDLEIIFKGTVPKKQVDVALDLFKEELESAHVLPPETSKKASPPKK